MQKYQVGQEIKLEYVGTITEAYIRDGVVYYTVKGDVVSTVFASENILCPLETPKES